MTIYSRTSGSHPMPFTTGWQTVGPWFAIGLDWDHGHEMANSNTPGRKVKISGGLFDNLGGPIPDAVIEFWQADANGKYNAETSVDPNWSGFGRAKCDAEGRYDIATIKPGAVIEHNGRDQAPHICVSVFARGILKRLCTRIYFPDESDSNASDKILNCAPPDRRQTLIARPAESNKLIFDIRLGGEEETVFFEF